MDFAEFLVSLNKVSLIALFIIIGFLSYQIYLLKKETGSKKKKLVIPDFKTTNSTPFPQTMHMVVTEEKKIFSKSSKTPLIFGLILFFIFGLVFIFGLLKSKSELQATDKNLVVTPVLNFVASKGIKIYNQSWVEFSDESLRKIKQGQHIIAAVATIKDSDIDMARIRVNKNIWNQDDITTAFKKEINVFFKEYIISTGESFLKVEAQIHSKTDGWLGD
ncbi:hypothetical protein HY041_00230 [Candidatus Roizmanbacteria bacterium]|nr:hypothetical protein [Candidatus Roizmanbacteria bacterium]